jgi:hypothetical protein
MALLAKPGGQRDFGERYLAFAEQGLRALDAGLKLTLG